MGAGTGDWINGSSVGDPVYTSGTLYKGVYESGSSLARVDEIEVAEAGNFIKSYTLTAAWVDSDGNAASAPSDAYDVAYLKGKTFNVTITPSGSARLMKADNKVSSLVTTTDYGDTSTAVVTISSSDLSLSVTSNTYGYVRLEPTQKHAAESGGDHGGSTDKLTPAANATAGVINFN